jgi:hypothetical protein
MWGEPCRHWPGHWNSVACPRGRLPCGRDRCWRHRLGAIAQMAKDTSADAPPQNSNVCQMLRSSPAPGSQSSQSTVLSIQLQIIIRYDATEGSFHLSHRARRMPHLCWQHSSLVIQSIVTCRVFASSRSKAPCSRDEVPRSRDACIPFRAYIFIRRAVSDSRMSCTWHAERDRRAPGDNAEPRTDLVASPCCSGGDVVKAASAGASALCIAHPCAPRHDLR